MAPIVESDLYGILNVNRTATQDDIKRSYHSLARKLHPDKNPNVKNATAQFQELQGAFEVLSDPDKRRGYDRQFAGSKPRQGQGGHDTAQSQSKSDREADDHVKLQKLNQEISTLQRQRRQTISIEADIEEEIAQHTAILQPLEERLSQIEQDIRYYSSWLAYLADWGSSRAQKKEQAERDRVDCLASIRIKRAPLERLQERLSKQEQQQQGFETRLEELAEKRAAVYRNILIREAQQAEARRQEAEAKRQAESQKRWEEEARKRQEEARQRAEEAQRRRKEKTQHSSDWFRPPPRSRKSKSHDPGGTRAGWSQDSQICSHAGFWPRIEGAGECENCHSYKRKFLLSCPGCDMKACAGCRRRL